MTLGFLLYREVRDYAPRDLTKGAYLAALMIADDANETTRLSWIAQPLLCYRTDLTPRGLRNALAELGGRGLEFRIVLSRTADGRPVYAAHGRAVNYLVPDFIKGGTAVPPSPVDTGHPRRHPSAAITIAKAAPEGREGGTTALEGGTPVPPFSSGLLTSPQRQLPTDPPDVEGSQPAAASHVHNPHPPGRWTDPRERARLQVAEFRAERERART